jgi:hypothetical protein
VINYPLSAADIPGATIRIACIGSFIDAVELFQTRKLTLEGGLFSRTVLSSRLTRLYRSPLLRFPDFIFGRRIYLLTMLLQALSAAYLILFPISGASLSLLCILLTIRVLLNFRHQIGGNGADHMLIIALSGIVVYELSFSPWARYAALSFICLQVLLSYFTAGVFKLLSPHWRKGTAINVILSTESYMGLASAARIQLGPRARLAVCWATILFECGAPLLCAIHPIACCAFILAGIVFHLSIAVVLGLNDFFWAFTATYPVLFWGSVTLYRLWHHLPPQLPQ